MIYFRILLCALILGGCVNTEGPDVSSSSFGPVGYETLAEKKLGLQKGYKLRKLLLSRSNPNSSNFSAQPISSSSNSSTQPISSSSKTRMSSVSDVDSTFPNNLDQKRAEVVKLLDDLSQDRCFKDGDCSFNERNALEKTYDNLQEILKFYNSEIEKNESTSYMRKPN